MEVRILQRPQNTSEDDCSQRDTLETEGYAEVCSNIHTEMNRQDGTNLIDQVIDHDNLYMAYKHVRANKGAPGIDGITVDELYGHMQQYYSSLRRKVRRSEERRVGQE